MCDIELKSENQDFSGHQFFLPVWVIFLISKKLVLSKKKKNLFKES